MAPRHRPFVWKWGENSRSPNGMKITSFFFLRACHIKRRCFALGFRQGGSEGKTEWEELRGTQRKKKREDCKCNGTGYTVDKSPMDVKQDKCAMISHPRPSVLSVRCVGQSKLLLRSLEWRPGEGKLDVAMTHSAFQSFPPSKDLGTGLSTDTCGRCQIQQHGSIKK